MERRGLLQGWLGAKRSRQATMGGPGVCAVERRGLLQGWLGAKRSRQATMGGPGSLVAPCHADAAPLSVPLVAG